MDLPTRLDLMAVGADVFARAKNVDPDEVYVTGSDVNMFAAGAAAVGMACVRQIAKKARAQYLDGCLGEEIDRWGYDRYREFGIRKGASPALGGIRFFRPAATAGAGTIPAGTKLQSLGQAEYITTTAATFGAFDLESRADVRAVQAGKATQVGANQIRRFANLGAIFDPTIQLTNDAPTAGGENREDDDTYKGRLKKFWAAARRGTKAAIEYGALLVPGVVSAQAIEATTTGALPARVMSLYIADSSGVASDQLAQLVRASLGEWRAGGTAVLVYTSLPQIVSIVLKLSFTANVATATVGEAVRLAIAEYVNSLEVNQALLRADLNSLLQRFKGDGLVPTDDSVQTPIGDLYPTPGQTLRATSNSVSLAT